METPWGEQGCTVRGEGGNCVTVSTWAWRVGPLRGPRRGCSCSCETSSFMENGVSCGQMSTLLERMGSRPSRPLEVVAKRTGHLQVEGLHPGVYAVRFGTPRG